MKPTKGWYFLKVEGRFKEKGEGGLYVPNMDTTILDVRTQEEVYVPHKFKRNYGEVVYCCEDIGDYDVRLKYESKVAGTRDIIPMTAKELGYGADIRKGDTVYFHYLENDWEDVRRWIYDEESGNHLLKIHVENLFCFERDGEVNMLNGKVLVEEIKGEFGGEVDWINGVAYEVKAVW
jgi:hypothetical protein